MKSTRRIHKDEARERMFYNLNKEQIIGIDPIFSNSAVVNTRLKREYKSEAWNKVSKQYDLEHRS